MSYVRWAGSGDNEEIQVGVDRWRWVEGDKVRKALNAAHVQGGKGGWLGGSRSQFVNSASEIAVPEYFDVLIDWRHVEGLTVKARVEVYTLNVGTSVTPRIKNVTDSVNTDGSVSTTVGWAERLITLPTPGVLAVKRYRFYLVGSNATYGIAGIGQIEVYDAIV